jgi:hypothetical protein
MPRPIPEVDPVTSTFFATNLGDMMRYRRKNNYTENSTKSRPKLSILGNCFVYAHNDNAIVFRRKSVAFSGKRCLL